MWPKAIAQLAELAPHIVRLVPMADRFFQSKSASDESTRRAMGEMAEGLRGDLGKVTASHAGLFRQLNEQGDRMTALSAEAHASRLATENIERRITGLERAAARQTILSAVLLAVALALLALLITLLLRAH